MMKLNFHNEQFDKLKLIGLLSYYLLGLARTLSRIAE